MFDSYLVEKQQDDADNIERKIIQFPILDLKRPSDAVDLLPLNWTHINFHNISKSTNMSLITVSFISFLLHCCMILNSTFAYCA